MFRPKPASPTVPTKGIKPLLDTTLQHITLKEFEDTFQRSEMWRHYVKEYTIVDPRNYPLGMVPLYKRMILPDPSLAHAILRNLKIKFEGVKLKDDYYFHGPFELKFGTEEYYHDISGTFKYNLLDHDYYDISVGEISLKSIYYQFLDQGQVLFQLVIERHWNFGWVVATFDGDEITKLLDDQEIEYYDEDGNLIINKEAISKIAVNIYENFMKQ